MANIKLLEGMKEFERLKTMITKEGNAERLKLIKEDLKNLEELMQKNYDEQLGHIKSRQFKELEFIYSYNPNSSTTGTPKYYGQFDADYFIIAPTPNSAFTVNLSYFYNPTSLTAGSDSGTTWLSENAENALLYGSLVECYTYMKGEQDIMNMYNVRFGQALNRLKNLGEAQEVSDEYYLGPIRKAKT